LYVKRKEKKRNMMLEGIGRILISKGEEKRSGKTTMTMTSVEKPIEKKTQRLM
jgi:hypothetical protein